jgi:ATP-dependent DNA helicase
MKTRKLLRKSTKSNTFCSNENVPFDCPDCPYICRITMQNTVMMLKKAVNHPYLIWTPIDPNAKSRQMFVSEDLIKHSGKLLVLEALLPKLKKMGHKVLIFSTMVMFMDMIEEMLLLRKYEFRRLDGSVDYTSRNNSIGDFMNDDKIFLFLLSTRAGGLGLNLTAADTVIFMDRDWNPMADLQAQDRCHRIGQTKPVVIYSLITKGTIDEIIEARGEMKKRLGKIVIQEGKFKTLSKNFDDDELKELEDLLKSEETSIKIRANGLIFTNNELNKILDRSDLIQQMKENQDKHDQN